MNNPAEVYKALADETRVRILALLHEDDLCVCQICGILGESQAKISRHLAKLRELKLVTTRRQEQFVRYSLNRDHRFLMDTLDVLHNYRDVVSVLRDDRDRSASKDDLLAACRSDEQKI